MEAGSGRLVVVGGGPAGMSAASTARRRQPNREIVVFEQGGFVSSILCVLPYFISGIILDARSLTVYTPEHFRKERRIQVLTGHRVDRIDPSRRRVIATDLDSGSRLKVDFETLVLATGAIPRRPSVHGCTLSGTYVLRSIQDAIEIKEALVRDRPRQAVIVGAGYVGLEMAEAFRQAGLGVTLLEAGDGVVPGLDSELSAIVQQELRDNGVAIHTGEALLGLVGDSRGRVRRATTENGEYDADIVLLATGIGPAADLAREAGVTLGAAGAVHVDDGMRTGVPNLLAAGDVAETWNRVSRQPSYIPLGTTANRQGRVAGDTASGGGTSFAGIVGTSALKVFGLEVARTGLSTAEAGEAAYWALGEFEVASTRASNPSKAAMYPGGSPIAVKLIAEKHSRRLLGAQMVGREGVAKRLDTLAVALHAGLTLDDIVAFDLTYAPPLAPSLEASAAAAQKLLREI